MVKLEEVEDAHFAEEQAGPRLEEEDDDYTDTESEISTDSEIEAGETLSERLAALKDMVPPRQRAALSSTVSSATSWVKSGVLFSGKSLWVIATSALLLGVPWALAFSEEQQMVEMEKEMEKEMRMQQSANELLTPGATSQLSQQLGGQQGKPAL